MKESRSIRVESCTDSSNPDRSWPEGAQMCLVFELLAFAILKAEIMVLQGSRVSPRQGKSLSSRSALEIFFRDYGVPRCGATDVVRKISLGTESPLKNDADKEGGADSQPPEIPVGGCVLFAFSK